MLNIVDPFACLIAEILDAENSTVIFTVLCDMMLLTFNSCYYCVSFVKCEALDLLQFKIE